MPQNPNDRILAALRAMVDAGGPSEPVPSHPLPTSRIEPVTPFQRLREQVMPMSDTEPLAQHGVFNAIFGQGEPTSSSFSPEDVMGMSPTLGSVSKKAAKGLVKGIQGFMLPEGKIARPDAAGVARIVEGDKALESLKQMLRPSTGKLNRESGFVPKVAGAHEVPDVAVPIPDSLDTAATPKLPLTGRHNLNKASRRTSKVNDTMIKDMRQLFDTGSDVDEINKLYPDLSRTTISEIVNRLSYPKVK